MFKLARKVLCLDWDTRSLRLVVARQAGGQVSLEDAHSHRIPDTVERDNPEALGDFIRQMLRRHHWSFKHAVVDISRDRAVIHRLTLPPTPDSELAAAVRFQAMKELPFPFEEAVVDYVVKERNERGLAIEVLLAAVTQETLGAVRATCEAAGLTPERIGLRPYANLLSVNHLSRLGEQRVLFVDVGPTLTEIDVMDQGRLAFARSTNVTMPAPAEAVGEDSRIITFESVSGADAEDTEVQAAVNELVVEITRTLQAFRATEPELEIDLVVIAGGTGVEPHLLKAVESRFKLETRLFDPTEALGVSPDEALKLRSFSAALGLAWGLTGDPAASIDFLNPKKPIPPRETLKRRLRIGGLAAGLLLAAGVAVDATFYLQRLEEYEQVRAETRKLKEELRTYLEMQNMVEEVEDWRFQSVWPEDLLRITECAVEPGKEMLVQQMSFEYRSASINMKKVLASHWDVPARFENKLNEYADPEGRRPYRASMGGWRPLRQAASKFEGAVDIQIELKELKQHLEGHEQRLKDRKKRLRGL